MKLHRVLALALSAILLLGILSPALAAEAAADQALMEVTAKVKATLELDTGKFDDFQGRSTENVLTGKRWTLSWSGDGVYLSITAGDDGKVYAYSYSESASDPAPVYNTVMGGGRFSIPSLPEDTSALCLEAANAFLSKVLTPGLETAGLEDNSTPSLYSSSHYYSTTLLLNGVPSPITCSVTVRNDGTVTRFSRSDQYAGYLGAVPSAPVRTSEAQAQLSLRSTLKFDLYYVLGEDKTATVQYVPLTTDDYYVDDATSSLVNLSELRAKLRSGSYDLSNKFLFADAAAAPESSLATGGLTQAELDGAAILNGVLSKEDLDDVLKNTWPEIGLDRYTLAGASYSIYEKPLADDVERTGDDYDVTCSLTYAQTLSGGDVARKYLTVDAKTGELKSLRASRPYDGEDIHFSYLAHVAQPTAEAALRMFLGAEVYDRLALFETRAAGPDNHSALHYYVFDQYANGYWYHGNRYTVAIDGYDGTLSYLSGYFDDEVELVDPVSVVSLDAAMDAYAAAMVKDYRYVAVPVSVDLAEPELRPLLKNAGYEFVEALKPGYVLAQPDSRIRGVDAKTGQVIQTPPYTYEEYAVTYDDLDNTWVKDAALALAVYRIGLPGGSLRPADPLTQLDMLTLLCSVNGSPFDPEAAARDQLDSFYERCYWLGLVTPETRDPDKTVTRGELVKLLLDVAGYSQIAAMPHIFRCTFSDEVPADQLGYAALAQGLGLVKGGSDGAYAAQRVATRAEAVAMLYQYMTRR